MLALFIPSAPASVNSFPIIPIKAAPKVMPAPVPRAMTPPPAPAKPQQIRWLKTVELRRAWGLGHGTGQMWVRIPKAGPQAPVEVLEVYMPDRLDSMCCSMPWQVRHVEWDGPTADADWEFTLVEIMHSSVSGLPFACTPHRPENSHNFQPFDGKELIVQGVRYPIVTTIPQKLTIEAFTGVAARLVNNPKPKALPVRSAPVVHVAPGSTQLVVAQPSRNERYHHGVLDDINIGLLRAEIGLPKPARRRGKNVGKWTSQKFSDAMEG